MKLKSELIVLSIAILPFSANANWWNNAADIGNWTPYAVHPFSKPGLISLVNASAGHPVRAGAQSIRFVRTRGGCVGAWDCGHGSQRTELNASGEENNGQERWYAWSVYHKDYQWIGGGVAPWEGQFKALNGPSVMQFVMSVHHGLVANFDHFEGWNPTVLVPKDQINNRWHDIRVHAKWSSGADGIFQIWVNGQLKVDRRGANFAGDRLLFRYGVYAPDVVPRTSDDPTQVVYYDEVMKGATCQSVSKFMPCPGAPQAPVPTVNVKVESVAMSRDDRGRFASEVDYAVTQFSDSVVFNRDAFSFKDYKHFVAYETSENRGMMLGISGNTDVDKHIVSPVGIGWLFDDFALMVANDNSILGFEKSRTFDYKNPTTTYVNLGYRKQLMNNVMLYSDLLYAYGDSQPGDNVTMSDIHALGFNAKLNYTPLENHSVVFSVDMPLHIESGAGKFVEYGMQGPYNLNVDMSPEGRHIDFGVKHIYQLTYTSMFSTEVHYINDADHRRGETDYSAIAKYNLAF